MNRIKLSPLAAETLGDVKPVSDLSAVATAESISLPSTDNYSLFVPMHYEKNYAYPLIVWLHSDGQNCEQIQQVMLDMSLRNYVGVAPQSPIGSQEAGFFWDQDCDTIDMGLDATLHAIDRACLRLNVASSRIFLAGAGSGGTMAFRLAFERPELFAGVISLNGQLPEGGAPLHDWSRCRQLPLFWAHQRHSHEFSEDQLCQQLRLMHIAGFSVTLRQYPQNDLLCAQTLADMNRWVMEMIETAVFDPAKD